MRQAPASLLVIGVHREELEFGRLVANALPSHAYEVLDIAQGLPGRLPRADEVFQLSTLHRELYHQLMPYTTNHDLIVDLHTGIDQDGPCADLFCHDPQRLACLTQDCPNVRIVQLGDCQSSQCTRALTVIPDELWDNPDCLYVGVEIYLSPNASALAACVEYAVGLLRVIQAPLQLQSKP